MNPRRFDGAAFDVVALAASAGGVTALSLLVSKLRPDFPAAVVLVQHLDPRHRSLMADILSRRTTLRVVQAHEGDHLSQVTIYVAPPDRPRLVIPDARLWLSHSR